MALFVGLVLGYGASTYAHGGGEMGGMSAEHMSIEGISNTNGPDSADRDKGRARAEDRMSAQGLQHGKAKTRGKKTPKGIGRRATHN